MPELNESKLIVDVKSQTMQASLKNGFTKTYQISTAANGIGSESGSFKTPSGTHTVCEKIGAFAPLYSIFKSRVDTGILCETLNTQIQEDLILTRILRLRGEEPGINRGTDENGKCVDSFERYIYIHGTNREDLLGKPASHGCIRMANKDIEELFLKIQQGITLEICTDTATAAPQLGVV